MNKTLAILTIAASTFINTTSFAAETVTINEKTATFCYWTSAASAMRTAAKAGPVSISNWSKFEKGSTEDIKCKKAQAKRKAARAKRKAEAE